MKTISRVSVLVVLMALMLPLLASPAALPFAAAQDGSPVADMGGSIQEGAGEPSDCSGLPTADQADGDTSETAKTCNLDSIGNEPQEATTLDEDVAAADASESILTLTVWDAETMLPIAGVDVVIHDGNDFSLIVASGQTDENGVLATPPLPNGYYDIETSHPDYVDNGAGISLSSDTTYGIQMTRRVPGALTITTVDDQTEEPIVGAAVVVHDGNDYSIIVAIGQTDDNGVFFTDQLPSGYYSIETTHPDYLDGSGWVFLRGDTSSPVSMTRRVPGTLTISIGDWQLEQPIAGAAVAVHDGNDYSVIVATGQTDGNGVFVTDPLPSGYYSIEAMHPEYFDGSIGIWLNGNSSTSVSMTRRAPGVLTVTVLDKETQDPVPGASVIVHDGNDYSIIVTSGQTDDNGVFATEQLPSGYYSIEATHPEYFGDSDYLRVAGDTNSTIFMTPRAPGILTVTVVDDQTAQPIAGAAVVVHDGNDSSIVVTSGQTDNNGVFITEQLPGDAFYLAVSHPDFFDTNMSVWISGDTNSTVSMTRRVAGTLTISVVDDQDERPVTGAMVTVRNSSTWQIVVSGETDDDGVFTTAQLPGEYYVIEVVHPDFLDDSIWVEVSGDTSSTVSMTRRVPGTITITVLDEQSEQPVAGAAVIVRDVTFSIVASGETDSNGLLVTQQLPGNHYYIAISHPDYLIQTTDVSVIGDASSTVLMTPRVPGVLAVTVLDEQTQEPVVGVAVVVRDGNDYSRIVASDETGEDGVFATEQLPSSSYYVDLSHPNYFPDSHWISLQGDMSNTFTLTPRVPGTLTATVTDTHTTNPIEGVMVMVWDRGDLVTYGKTGSDGVFTTEQLPSSDYEVELSHPSYLGTTEYVRISGDTDLTASMVAQVTGVLTVTAVDEQTDQPLAGATVVIRDENDFEIVSYGETDSAGVFATGQLLSGNYYVSVSQPGYASSTVWVGIQGDVSTNISMPAVPIPEPGTLAITVLDDHTNEPIEGATITVRDNEDNLVAYGKTGSDGLFITDRLPSGDYYLHISRGGYAEGFDSVSVDGGVSSTISLIPQAPGTLTITALDEQTGQPIEGATVAVWNSESLAAYGYTDTGGIFTTDQLPGGDHTIELRTPPFR